MAREHILIVEDDENIQQLVGYNLTKAGYHTIYADTGEQALSILSKTKPDLILLDLMLPELSGVDVCKTVKTEKQTSHIPIIILTAKGEEEDITAGLDLGADDYITKPFSPKVLLSRIKAVLRRQGAQKDSRSAVNQPVIKINDLVIDSGRHEVSVQGETISLTVTEFGILEFLARHPGWVYSRQQIIDQVRGYDYLITPRAVDVQVFGLRKKLGDAGKHIETVRGIGYRFREEF